jgi:hypothetical protein
MMLGYLQIISGNSTSFSVYQIILDKWPVSQLFTSNLYYRRASYSSFTGAYSSSAETFYVSKKS